MSNRRLYASESFPGRKFTADEVRDLTGRPTLNVCLYAKRGTPVDGHLFADVGAAERISVPRGVPEQTKDIRCDCPECGGRSWLITEIIDLPNYPGGVVNRVRIRKIGDAVGHPLFYPRPDRLPAGTWHPATAPAPRPAGAAPAMIFNGGMPISPKRLDIVFIAGGEGGGT